MFTNLFHQRFPKHEYLDSTHELMQQVYIEMKTEPGCFCLIPGDLSMYTLKYICSRQSITAPWSIGETLYHALIAMLCHWDMIGNLEPPGKIDITYIPLVCTSLDSYHQALALFKETLSGSYEDKDEFDVWCEGPRLMPHYKSSFCDAVKVDISKTNESYYQEIITHTLSL
jgi:hypothetical protein